MLDISRPRSPLGVIECAGRERTAATPPPPAPAGPTVASTPASVPRVTTAGDSGGTVIVSN